MSVHDSVTLLRLQARLGYLEEEVSQLRSRSRGRFRHAASRKLADDEIEMKLAQIENVKKEIEHIMHNGEPD